MDGSPRLLSSLGLADLFRSKETILSLEYIFCIHVSGYPVKEPFPEVLFNILPDDEDYLAKT